MKVSIILLIVMIAFSCKPKRNSTDELINVYTSAQIEHFKQSILTKGDTIAYSELGNIYMKGAHEEEYLVYSLIMANKFKYKNAYFYVYDGLMKLFETENGTVDDEIKDLALKYIKKGAELKDGNSLIYLSRLYKEGKFVPKDTILGNKLRMEAFKIYGF